MPGSSRSLNETVIGIGYDFHLSDSKSLEFMHILDKEYKSGLRDDFTALEKKMNEGFQSQAKQFDDLKEEFRELRSDVKIELSEMRKDIRTESGNLRNEMQAELSAMRKDMQVESKNLRNDMQMGFASLRNDMQMGFTGLRSDLRVEIKDSKVEAIRWSIALFLTLVGMIVAVYLKK